MTRSETRIGMGLVGAVSGLFGMTLMTVAAITFPGDAVLAQERVLTIFGKDRCPVNTTCVVRPETERYRIPKELRVPPPAPEGQSWTDRSRGLADLGRSGTGSCSPSGAGGWTGCWARGMKEARAERAELKKEMRDPTNP